MTAPQWMKLSVMTMMALVSLCLGTDRLEVGDKLCSDELLQSENGRFVLWMQEDGDLVLYARTAAEWLALWASNTAGSTGDRCVFYQSDGNVVMYPVDESKANIEGKAIWNSNTWRNPGERLVLQNDGNLVAYDTKGVAYWSAQHTLNYLGTDRLEAGDKLCSGELLLSEDGRFMLTMQRDGNLVLYERTTAGGGLALWHTGTDGSTEYRCVYFQGDGNLVMYNEQFTVIWASDTERYSGGKLLVQNDGDLVAYDTNDVPYWRTRTTINYLRADEKLCRGETLTSRDDAYTLYMQADGNLVLYDEAAGGALWATNTNTGHCLVMQSAGNIVLYDEHENAVWQSWTANEDAEILAVENYGNLVAYNTERVAFWSSKTGRIRDYFAPLLKFDRAAASNGYPLPVGDTRLFYELNVESGSYAVPFDNRDSPRNADTFYQSESCGAYSKHIYRWFYGYQHECMDGTGYGEHIADWEQVMVHLNEYLEPYQMTYWQHGDWYTTGWDRIDTEGAHPVVYVGKNSHGSYYDSNAYLGGCGYFFDYRNPDGEDDVWRTWQRGIYPLDDEDFRHYDGDWNLRDGGISQDFDEVFGYCDLDDCKGLGCNWDECDSHDNLRNPANLVNSNNCAGMVEYLEEGWKTFKNFIENPDDIVESWWDEVDDHWYCFGIFC